MSVRRAGPADLDDVRALFREYQKWLADDLCFESFEEELAGLPGRYAEPAGRILIAHVDGQPAGAVALRDLGDGICEMKRLYVRAEFQGHQLGRALVERLIAEARAAGYRAMRLDTLPGPMAKAVRMYESMGFRDIPAYTHNPVPDARFLELDLVSSKGHQDQ
jgi:putative acetyltransferase